jgi:NADH dehydrogenase FAD-containing subunit
VAGSVEGQWQRQAIGTGSWWWAAGSAGFPPSGLWPTRTAEVTLVERTNHHLFQPLLYQVAAGILPPALIAPTPRHVLRGQLNA